ncbi:MAG TPA: GAP family protein, partial [bacterium]|nr:GAP family protein [bacterium]
TTFQIVLFVLLLATEKPLRNALAYLAGLSGAYFACGLAGYLALDQLRDLLDRLLPSAKIPNLLYYQTEFLMGIVMAAVGVWYFYRKKKAGISRRKNWIIARLQSMNGWVALAAGFFMSFTSFPVSTPYLAVLGRYWALHLSLGSAAVYILFYNLGYALPMVLILILYLRLRRKTEDVHGLLHKKADLLNVHLTTWTCVGFGLLCMVDAGCYFAFGRGLMQERLF